MIKQQRNRNKWVLYAVYLLLIALVLYVLYEMFGFMIPSFSSGSPVEAEGQDQSNEITEGEVPLDRSSIDNGVEGNRF